MKRRLPLFIALASVACLGIASLASAQTCQEIHNLGSNGCAPSGLAGNVVTLQGVCYVEAGTYNSGSVYWQCSSGGGLLFFNADADPNTGLNPVSEGDLIEVMGTVSAFGSEIQLDGASWTVMSQGNPLVPVPIATGDLAAGTDMLGDFMVVQGVLSLVSSGFNSTYELDDGTGPVTVFVDGTTGIDTATMDTYLGDVVEIKGATKCFNDVGEILPRRDDDITLKQVATESQSWGAVKSRF